MPNRPSTGKKAANKAGRKATPALPSSSRQPQTKWKYAAPDNAHAGIVSRNRIWSIVKGCLTSITASRTKKIVELMYNLYGYEVNESTITGTGEQCYRSLSQTEVKNKEMILGEPVLHADETGIRVEGSLRWLHTQGTQLYTRLFVHEKRGMEAMESQESVLPAYRGWMVHDCLGGYFHFVNSRHAVCGAHLLRELQGLVKSGKPAWAGKFKSFLLSVYNMPHEERAARRQTIIDRHGRL